MTFEEAAQVRSVGTSGMVIGTGKAYYPFITDIGGIEFQGAVTFFDASPGANAPNKYKCTDGPATGKLTDVSARFDPAKFHTISEILIKKFGEGSVKKSSLMIAGTEYGQIEIVWQTTSALLMVSKFGSSVDKGFIMLVSSQSREGGPTEEDADTEALRKGL
jgi:hypothetical protein